MKFNNTIDKKTFIEKYYNKLIIIPDFRASRLLIGYNYNEDVVIVETPTGKLIVKDLADAKLYNISSTRFVAANKYSFKELIKLNYKR